MCLDGTECWRPVPYAPFDRVYAVSCRGRVKRSILYRNSNRATGGILKRHYDDHGYARATMTANGRRKNAAVHKMVALAFLSPPAPGQTDARHLNGNPRDCTVANLAWGTHRENGQDMVNHDRSTRGARNRHAKLTDDIIRTIRADAARGELRQEIAAHYGITPSNVGYIVARKTWKHVP